MSARAKLDAKRALKIWESRGTHVAIASEHNISPSAVGDIKQGKTWRHVTGAPRYEGPSRKVTTAEQIELLRADKGSFEQRAEKYGMSLSTVKRYARGTGKQSEEKALG